MWALMFLIDTNVISEAFKGVRADAGVLAFWDDACRDQTPLFLASVTIGELRRGVTLIRHRGDHPQAVLLEQWLEDVLQIHGDRVLDLDGDAAQIWGRLRVSNPHNTIDKQIAVSAAAALSGGLLLLNHVVMRAHSSEPLLVAGMGGVGLGDGGIADRARHEGQILLAQACWITSAVQHGGGVTVGLELELPGALAITDLLGLFALAVKVVLVMGTAVLFNSRQPQPCSSVCQAFVRTTKASGLRIRKPRHAKGGGRPVELGVKAGQRSAKPLGQLQVGGVVTREAMASGQGQDPGPAFCDWIAVREEGEAAEPGEEAIAVGLRHHGTPFGDQQGIAHLQVPEPRDPPRGLPASGKQAMGTLTIAGLFALKQPGQGHRGVDHHDIRRCAHRRPSLTKPATSASLTP
jgi:toxin FitB